jgi:cyclic lactone autoinducer peptide
MAMKKISYRLTGLLATLAYLFALSGGGLASDWGWYQPKVPEKLCK